MNSLVTVIIPIFNVDRFIEHGLDNILTQSYPNIEVILVNDGSTDNSASICDSYSTRYSNIRVIHKENGGAGSARNAGIESARGDFIYFFDIDDDAYPNLIAENVQKMMEMESDMNIFGFDVTDTLYNDVNDHVSFPETMVTSNGNLKDAFLSIILPTRHGNGFPWNKFYRKAFLDKHHLRYEDQRIQQDEVFNLKCYQKAERVYFSPNIYYHYYIYYKGNTRSRYIPDRFEIMLSVRNHFEELRHFWNIHSVDFDGYLNRRFFISVDDCIRFNLFHKKCPLSLREKKERFHLIVNHPFAKSSFSYAINNRESFSSGQVFFARLMSNSSFAFTLLFVKAEDLLIWLINKGGRAKY